MSTGAGDIALTLGQRVPQTGAIATTLQAGRQRKDLRVGPAGAFPGVGLVRLGSQLRS